MKKIDERKIFASEKMISNSRTENYKRQRYELRNRVALNEVPELPVVTHAQFRAFVRPHIYQQIGCFGVDSDEMDGEFLRARYGSEGGLTRFLCECFPASTSKSPYGRYQLRSIAIAEEVLRNGGQQQLLEPRSSGKSSKICRAVLWAMLFDVRKSVLLFQSSKTKSRYALEAIKNELVGNVAIRAMFPVLAACCVHAESKNRTRQTYNGVQTAIEWKVDSIALPAIPSEPYATARCMALPFGSATGATRSNATTLADARPDALVIDDVEPAAKALSSPTYSQKLFAFYQSSIAYLAAKSKSSATLFCQTLFSDGDFASLIQASDTVQSVRYGMLIKPPDNLEWWLHTYRTALLNYSARGSQRPN